MSKEAEVAKLRSVSVNEDGEVFATFKVIDQNYKDFVLRWASQEEGAFVVRGDTLYVKETKGKMRTAPGKEV